VLVDDSTRPLFDSSDFSFKEGEKSPWPWVIERPAGERQDWYFFGYGHDYRQALGDYVRVAGRIPLPPRFAFGAWWSRYWAYSDQEIEEIIRGFHERRPASRRGPGGPVGRRPGVERLHLEQDALS
jgi:alpha-glucosidase